MRKKLIAGATVLALLMSAPQAKADDEIVIFGGEFEDEATPPAPKKVKKPAQVKETPPPVEKPAPPPEIVEPQPQPIEKVEPQPEPEVVKPQPQPIEKVEPQPEPEVVEPQPQPIEKVEPQPEPEVVKPQPQPIEKVEPQPEPIEPLTPTEYDRPFEQPTDISGRQEPIIVIPPKPAPTTREPSIRREPLMPRSTLPQKELKMLKPRFMKLAVDDTYTYYLDKSSVQWKKLPYSSSEYMADVWIRMIEREPAPLDNDMENYGSENFRAEVALARDQGYQYPPEDLKVLRSQAYVLEHYYLRPKTKQIQFLCELEVFGRPQNAINERAYDYKNWENLVPGSVESTIYEATIKILGTSKASERGHMTFIDMLEEYGRISLR